MEQTGSHEGVTTSSEGKRRWGSCTASTRTTAATAAAVPLPCLVPCSSHGSPEMRQEQRPRDTATGPPKRGEHPWRRQQ